MPATLDEEPKQPLNALMMSSHMTSKKTFLSFLFLFFFEDSGNKFLLCGTETKDQSSPLSPSPPSFTTWVYILFKKAQTKL